MDSTANKPSLNLSFGCKNLPDLLPSLKISIAPVSYCTVGKLMGLTTDSKLQSDNHFQYTCNTVFISIGNISKLKSLLPLACLKKLDILLILSVRGVQLGIAIYSQWFCYLRKRVH